MTLKSGSVVGGKYRIDARQSAGRRGETWLATDEKSWGKVAIELLDASDAELASLESQARAAQEAHPAIAPVHATGSYEGQPWIARDFFDGETLGARQARGALRPADAVTIGSEIARILGAAHTAGVVHGALDPEQILLERADDGERVRLLGFGHEAVFDANRGSGPLYLAPEQAGGESPTPRSDLYSLSAVLFGALAGRPPHTAESAAARAAAGPAPMLASVAPSVPTPLSVLIDRGLSEAPDERPPDATGFAVMLTRALEGASMQATVAGSSETPATVALDAAQIQASVSAAGVKTEPGDGWHPAPQAAPIAGGAAAGSGFGAPPQGPIGPGSPQPKSNSGNSIMLIVGLVAGLGLLAVLGLVFLGVGAGMVGYMTARQAPEPVVWEPPPSVEPDIYEPVIEPPAAAEGSITRFRVPVTTAMPQRGASDPVVTIVTFSDYQCPFCSRVNPTIERVLREHPNDVRYVWRDNPLPFHQNAMPAAEVAREAYVQRGDAGFWAMHAALFENQRSLNADTYDRLAAAQGLDVSALRAALADHRHRAAIQADQALTNRLGARGTPAFFINGRKLSGAQPFERFNEVIRDEIARARSLTATGTPRSAIYGRYMASARTTAAPEEARPNRAAPDPSRVYTIAVPPNAPSMGPANAPVTLQLFSDFQCPFCGRIGPTIRQVRERYPTQVRVVWRNYPLPFHNNAFLAAEAATEVHAQLGDEAFWRYHDMLFENQRELERPNLERLAQRVGGVNMSRFRAALDNHTHRAAVQADMDAITSAGARIGTPSSFINGRLLQGAQPFNAFQTAIDAAL